MKIQIEIPVPIFKIRPRGIVLWSYGVNRYVLRWKDKNGWCWKYEIL